MVRKKVLFVCVRNSGRSQMAEAFFNRLGRGKHRAFSAGTAPARELNPVVVQVMHEMGFDMTHQQPKLLTPEMLASADRVITMGCGADGLCPARVVPMEDWGIEDPEGKPVAKVREIAGVIRGRVERLLGELEKEENSGIERG
ncbi:MAG: arsenate reductase ArsC [Dehalococcoidales bacterium]|nr:arsenate reductase ArsC [Dehalococcoidales bacterium]